MITTWLRNRFYLFLLLCRLCWLVQKQKGLQSRSARGIRGGTRLYSQPIRTQCYPTLFFQSATRRVTTEERHINTEWVHGCGRGYFASDAQYFGAIRNFLEKTFSIKHSYIILHSCVVLFLLQLLRRSRRLNSREVVCPNHQHGERGGAAEMTQNPRTAWMKTVRAADKRVTSIITTCTTITTAVQESHQLDVLVLLVLLLPLLILKLLPS